MVINAGSRIDSYHFKAFIHAVLQEFKVFLADYRFASVTPNTGFVKTYNRKSKLFVVPKDCKHIPLRHAESIFIRRSKNNRVLRRFKVSIRIKALHTAFTTQRYKCNIRQNIAFILRFYF